MADWIQRTVTRNLLGTTPAREFRAYSRISANPSTGVVYAYNGVWDASLNALATIYDNALLEFTASNNQENQRNRSNWETNGVSNAAMTPLAANATTPTMLDRHSTYDLDGAGDYLYFFYGLSTNPQISKTFANTAMDLANQWIDLTADITPLCTGEMIRMTTTGSLSGTGFATGTNYYVIRINSTRFKLASSYANAKAGTAITITGQGTGNHTITYQTASSGIGNHPSDLWRLKVSSGAGQYVWEQLYPAGDQPYNVPQQAATTPAAQWYPPLSCFIIMNLNTDGFTIGNRTTWLYYPASNTYERLAAYTNNLGGPQSGQPGCMSYDSVTDGGVMWFFGGEGSGNALWKFKSDKTWTQVTPGNTPPSTRVNFGLVFANGKLWLQGGEATDGGTNRNDFWNYDPITNEWTQDTVAVLPTSANFTYMAFDGTRLVLSNNLLEYWTNDIPSNNSLPVGSRSLLGVGL